MSDNPRPAVPPPWETRANIEIALTKSQHCDCWTGIYDTLKLRYGASRGTVTVWGDDYFRSDGVVDQVVRRVERLVGPGDGRGVDRSMGSVEVTEEVPKKAGVEGKAAVLKPPKPPSHTSMSGSDVCSNCKGMNFVRTGTCLTCQDCGTSTGCS